MNPFRWLNETLCDHEDIRVTEGNRVHLKCIKCLRETCGVMCGKATVDRPVPSTGSPTAGARPTV